jgi:hypothetical protein
MVMKPEVAGTEDDLAVIPLCPCSAPPATANQSPLASIEDIHKLDPLFHTAELFMKPRLDACPVTNCLFLSIEL